MPAPTDRAYAIASGRLATLLGVSIAAARRRVDQQAAREGVRDSAGRVAIAERMITEAEGNGARQSRLLDGLLTAEGHEANYLDED
jgi:hypothetical protein